MGKLHTTMDYKQFTNGKLTLWPYSCVDISSVSCVISRLAHKVLCILGHMQRHWHETGRLWFDQGSAAFYSSMKKNHRSCVKASLSLIHSNISFTHMNRFLFKMACEQFYSRYVIFNFFSFGTNKCGYLNILWSDSLNTCIICRFFCMQAVKI